MDYAEELLGGPKPAPSGAGDYDYAEILNAPTTAEPRVGLHETPSGYAPGTVAAPVSGSGMGFAGGFKSAIPADPQTRLKIVAEQLFPGDPKGIERVGMKNGRLVFVNNRGQLEFADSGVMTGLGEVAANLPEIVASIGGSLTPAGPMLGAAVGGVTGKAWKQVLSNLIFDEPQTVGGNVGGMAKEGAINLATGGIAKGASAMYGRNAVRNAENFDKAQADATIDRIFQKTGIKLDYAQAGNLPQLRNLKKWAAKYPSEAQDIIETMDREQADQVAQAIESRILGRLSQESDPAALAASGVNAAQAAIKLAKTKRTADTRKYYEQADPLLLDSAAMKYLNTNEHTAALHKSVLSDKLYKDELRELAIPKEQMGNTIRSWDLTRRALRDQEESARRAGMNDRARLLGGQAERIEKALEGASPNYKRAMDEWRALSKTLVEPLENGTLGVLAKIEGPKMAQTVAQVMDDLLANPQAVAFVKLQLKNTQGNRVWNDVLRLSLSKAFNKASKETQAGDALNVAGKFRQAVIGTPAQKRAMQNAIGETGVQAFDDIMEAVQYIAKDLRNRPASDTQAFLAIERQQADKAHGFLRSVGVSALRGANPFKWSEILDNFGKERKIQESAVRIANALSDSKAIKNIAELQKLKPSRERSLAVLSIAGLGIPIDEKSRQVFSTDVVPQASQGP